MARAHAPRRVCGGARWEGGAASTSLRARGAEGASALQGLQASPLPQAKV